MPANSMGGLEHKLNLNRGLPWWLTDKQLQWQFLATKNMAVVPNSPYLPDLASWNFLFFLRMKSQLQKDGF
jgi:hypothetical protein